MEYAEKVHGLFLDLTKAYDSVPHQWLLNKHENIGIRGNVKNWFIDYFKNRKQKVRIDKVESSEITIERGILQGT